jgi:putative hydrolase of the HAD superfamily
VSQAFALILDFGGVVTRTLFETHEHTEKALCLASGSLTWRGPFAPESDPLWMAMQADEISERDYWRTRTREVGEMVGQSWEEMSDFVIAARGAQDPAAFIRPEVQQTIEAAKCAGASLAILSNELDLFYGTDFRGKLPLLSHFDVIVDASYTNILKPSEEAYRQCALELGIAPTRCVFVDDQQRNIVGAERVGMRTVAFDVRNPGQSFESALTLINELSREHDHA